MPAFERFQQLALRFTDPVQHDYEVIRGTACLMPSDPCGDACVETGDERLPMLITGNPPLTSGTALLNNALIDA
jgi:hypothetical protein